MLSEKESEEIKNQIINQIEKTFPEEKKEFAKQQILSMNPQQLEEFLKKNKLIPQQECIFCLITSEKIKSYKVDESNEAVAVLEINPISKAHTLIIPKEHQPKKEIPKNIQTFVEKVSKKIKEKFNPKEIRVFSSELFGHGFINILPVYEKPTKSERHKASEEELIKIQKEFEKKSREKLKKREEKIYHLPKRIP